MNVQEKKDIAKEVLDSILSHDDAELKEVEAVIQELSSHLQKGLQDARTRRKVKATSKESK